MKFFSMLILILLLTVPKVGITADKSLFRATSTASTLVWPGLKISHRECCGQDEGVCGCSDGMVMCCNGELSFCFCSEEPSS